MNFRNRYLIDLLSMFEELRELLSHEFPAIKKDLEGFSLLPRGFRVKRVVKKINESLSPKILEILQNHPSSKTIRRLLFVARPRFRAQYTHSTRTVELGLTGNFQELSHVFLLPLLAHEILHALQRRLRDHFFEKIDVPKRYVSGHRDPMGEDLNDYLLPYFSTIKERQAWYVGIVLSAAYHELEPDEFARILETVKNSSTEFQQILKQYPLLADNLTEFYDILKGKAGLISNEERAFIENFIAKIAKGYREFYPQYTRVTRAKLKQFLESYAK